MKQPPRTAVVIATCKRNDLLRRTLLSIAEAPGLAGLQEVLVVENGGAHGAAAVVESLSGRLPGPRHLLVDEGNKCRALNLGLDATEAEFICFFDDDVVVEPGTLGAYLDAAARYGPGYHFSGPLIAEWEAEPPDWLKPYLPPSATGWDKGREERFYDRPHFIGSNWAVFRKDVLGVGGFDERIGPGSPSGAVGDEMELQQRLLDAGNRGVYLPMARVRHHVPTADCNYEWARRRQRIHGRTYGVLDLEPEQGAISDGFGGWLRLSVLTLKVLMARLLGWSDERRAYLEMTRARTAGYLQGARIGGQRGFRRRARPSSD